MNSDRSTGVTLGFGALRFGAGVSVDRILCGQQLAPEALQGWIALSAMAAWAGPLPLPGFRRYTLTWR